MDEIKFNILFKNISKVFFFLVIFLIIFLIFTKGLNSMLIKINNTKNNVSNKLNKNYLKTNLNEKIFNILINIQSFFSNKYISFILISILIIFLWVYIFFKLLNSYFSDSKILTHNYFDKYNIKHIFNFGISEFEREKWINENDNNYITNNGKVCSLNPSLFNLCIKDKVRLGNNYIFKNEKNILTDPVLIKSTIETRIKEGDGIYIKNCYEDELTEEGKDCSYNYYTIKKVLYNSKKFITDKLQKINGVENKIFSFNDSRILFKLKKYYYFDILVNNLFNFFNLKEEKSITDYYTKFDYIKCRYLNGNINSNGNIKNARIEIMNEYLDENDNNKYIRVKSDKQINRNLFITTSYLNYNLKIDTDIIKSTNKKKNIDYENKTNNELMILDLSNNKNPLIGSVCIVNRRYNDLIEGDLVELQNDGFNNNNKSYKTFKVKKYNDKMQVFDNTLFDIDRNYLICSDTDGSNILSQSAFNKFCMYKQESNTYSEEDKYGCK